MMGMDQWGLPKFIILRPPGLGRGHIDHMVKIQYFFLNVHFMGKGKGIGADMWKLSMILLMHHCYHWIKRL